MQDRAKVTVTGLIWCVVLLVLRSAYWAPIDGGTEISSTALMGMVAILGAVAVVSTAYVWRSDRGNSLAMSGDKAKRERLLRTLGSLDDDEAAAMLDDLKVRLHGGDSEVSAVDKLSQERRRN